MHRLLLACFGVLVAACSTTVGTRPLPPPVTSGIESSAALAPTASSAPVWAVTQVTSGTVTMGIEAAAVDAAAQLDGSVRLAITPGSPHLAGRVTAPVGGALSVLDDGSMIVSDAAGLPVGGVARPTDPAGGAAPRLVAADSATVEVLLSGGQTTPIHLWFGTTTIASAEWGEREGGSSLAVVPTAWTRAGGQAGREAGWTALVRLVPDAGSPGMRNQFDCHAIGAPDKDSWNLEPWRPDVGLVATLTAACNP